MGTETVRHVVMFSGGVGSWAAARRVIDRHGTAGVTLLFADTLIEDEDLYRFLEDAGRDLGVPITRLAEGRTPWQVFADERFLGNTRVDPCSRILKRELLRAWLEAHADPAVTTVHVGIDANEIHRLDGVRLRHAHGRDGCRRGWCRSLFANGERLEGPGCPQMLAVPWAVDAPLCWRPAVLFKEDMLRDLASRGIEVPRLYRLGMPHNNCGGGCVKAGQGQFAHLLRVLPERFAEWEREEQKMRDQLGDVAILRDRTGGVTRPLPLVELRRRIEADDTRVDQLDIGGCGCVA